MTIPALRGWYLSLTRPPGTPPGWMLGPVWTVLSFCVGISGWLGWRCPYHQRALRRWGWLLLINALWAPCFFACHLPGIALALIVVVIALTAATIRALTRLRPVSGVLLLPSLVWTCYAAYLNAGFWLLNSG